MTDRLDPRRLARTVAGLILAPFLLVAGLVRLLTALAPLMPGVTVRTATRSGPGARLTAPSGTYFVTGLTERGPTNAPVELRSMADYLRLLGNRVTYGTLFDDLTAFFAEGGARAYVARVVGPAAAVATLTLDDDVASPALQVDAVNAGAWAHDVTVEVLAGTTAGFQLVVTFGDDVETYDNLDTAAAAVAALENSAVVRGTDLGNGVPAVAAAAPLAGGDDDRAAVDAAAMVTAADNLFGIELGDGAIAIPGQDAATVGAGLIAHAKANRRVVLLSAAAGASQADARAAAAGLVGTDGAEYATVLFPYVVVPDGSGSTRTISPEGFTAGLRARAHELAGPWVVPAGQVNGQARHAVDVAEDIDRTDGDALDTAHVSAIRLIAAAAGSTNRVPTLYGWRSLSDDVDNYPHLKERDLLNFIVVGAEQRLEQFVFRNIDGRGQLFAELEAELTGFIDPVADAGGLYERIEGDEVVDPGYLVDTGPAVNTAESIAAGQAKGRLDVRPSPTGSLVELTVTKVGVNAAL